ncbi:hypothetical protein IP92_03706 [Pseudoduganella flava]|uniref:Uncharacterized protein n=1 Tax=Pseudoduganella flava TaxID=871742 RepID=A0A562PLS2_9BURK|nr:hypothetical protein [Pseudoduganella flava]QGZ40985.1 hypothetical protein GO485_19185 [Pseudoduganella flava]TWI45328.1 hypothetical protein IP92_03706 [Pseudoduganella flava]
MTGIDVLLPNEPRIADDRQRTLTERHLLPALGPLRALFLHLRTQLDPQLAARQSVKLGMPYPHGQSLEIASAIQAALNNLDPDTLPPNAAEGIAALVPFLMAGGDARVTWGVRHGAQFHNALLLGTLYVDVAQDAAAPHAAPVALLPFADAGMVPLRDHRHFALLAGRCWEAQVYPNHLLPELAPYAPLIVLIPGASLRLESDAAYMAGLAAAGGFASPARVLEGATLPEEAFRLAAGLLQQAGIAMPTDPAAGRLRALELCARYRDQGRRPGDAYQRAALERLAHVNTLLQPLVVSRA